MSDLLFSLSLEAHPTLNFSVRKDRYTCQTYCFPCHWKPIPQLNFSVRKDRYTCQTYCFPCHWKPIPGTSPCHCWNSCTAGYRMLCNCWGPCTAGCHRLSLLSSMLRLATNHCKVQSISGQTMSLSVTVFGPYDLHLHQLHHYLLLSFHVRSEH